MNAPGALGKHRIAVAALLFLISGFAALVYQVIWQRVIGVFSGVHIYSITVIVSAFMAGLGVGSLIAGRFADRTSRRKAVIAFGLCELGIGIVGWFSPWLYYDFAYRELGFLVAYPLGLPLVHFALLIVPTFLMGASLPLLARGLVDDSEHAAPTIGILYGVNTLGAALGAFASIWWLVGSFGFESTLRGAALLNGIAAIGAFWIQRSLDPTPPPLAEAGVSKAESRGEQRSRIAGWAAAYGLSGFIALSLEILWFRFLDVSIKSSPYTFGHLLGMFLFFLAVGSLVGSRTVQRSRNPGSVFLWGQWCISLTAGAFVLAFFQLSTDTGPLAALYTYWGVDVAVEFHRVLAAWEQWGQGDGQPLPPVLRQVAILYLVLPSGLLGIPVFLMGFTYAYIQKAVQTDPREVGWRVGLVQAANIAGSIAGSVLTGVFFLNVLGTPATLRLLVLAGMTFGLLAAFRLAGRSRAIGVIACATTSVALVIALPSTASFWSRLHGAPPGEMVIAEDASSVVAMQPLERGWSLLRVNGTGHSLLPFYGAHTLLGALPGLLAESPRDVLVIGLGTGTTAWAASCVPGVERLDVFEIAAPEFEVTRRYLEQHPNETAATHFYEDPRVSFHFSDGRLALRTQKKKYDVIEVDALEPYMAYSGNLYSQEFFEEARDSLAPCGVFCTYAPTERTRRTLLEVFPHALYFEGESIPSFAIATNEPLSFDRERLLQKLESREFQECVGTATLGSRISAQLLQMARSGNPTTFDRTSDRSQFGTEINTDLFPRDEYDKSLGGDTLRDH